MRGNNEGPLNRAVVNSASCSAVSPRFRRGLIAALWFFATMCAGFMPLAHGSDATKSGSDSNGEIHAHVTQTLQHKNWATSLAWSPDGKLLATGSRFSHDVTIWDMQSGKIARALDLQHGVGGSIAFVGGDQYLLTPAATDIPSTALNLWDISTGTITHQVAGSAAIFFVLDKNQKMLASMSKQSVGSPIVFYDSQSWELTKRLSIPEVLPQTFDISPDGKTIAVGTPNGYIKIFDVASLALLRTIDAYVSDRSSVTALHFSPDGRFLASGSSSLTRYRAPDGTFPLRVPSDPIRIWKVADGSLAHSFSVHLEIIRDLAWSPNGQYLASANGDRTVRLWRVDSESPGLLVTTFADGSPHSLAFSPDGSRLAACGQRTAIISEIER